MKCCVMGNNSRQLFVPSGIRDVIIMIFTTFIAIGIRPSNVKRRGNISAGREGGRERGLRASLVASAADVRELAARRNSTASK